LPTPTCPIRSASLSTHSPADRAANGSRRSTVNTAARPPNCHPQKRSYRAPSRALGNPHNKPRHPSHRRSHRPPDLATILLPRYGGVGTASHSPGLRGPSRPPTAPRRNYSLALHLVSVAIPAPASTRDSPRATRETSYSPASGLSRSSTAGSPPPSSSFPRFRNSGADEPLPRLAHEQGSGSRALLRAVGASRSPRRPSSTS